MARKPDRWIIGAQRWHLVELGNGPQPAKLYELTFDPATRHTTLTPLPVAPLRADLLIPHSGPSYDGRQLTAATLSPDGQRLARDRGRRQIPGRGLPRRW